MKHFLLIITVVMVGCGEPKEDAEARAVAEAKEQSAIIEKGIRKLFEMYKWSLENPEGELTEADLEKVTGLMLSWTKITDEGLKELTQMKTLIWVGVDDTKVTHNAKK